MSCFVDACPSQAVTGEIDPLRGLRPARLVLASGRVLAWWREARRSFVITPCRRDVWGLAKNLVKRAARAARIHRRSTSASAASAPSTIAARFAAGDCSDVSFRHQARQDVRRSVTRAYVAVDDNIATIMGMSSQGRSTWCPTRLLTPLPNRRDQSNQEVQGAEIVHIVRMAANQVS